MSTKITDDPAELAAEIRQARKAKGWTQEQLAEHAQLSVRTIRNLEAGRSVQPGNLGMVLRALGREPAAPQWPDDVEVIVSAVGHRLMALSPAERAELGADLIRFLITSANQGTSRVKA